AVGHLALALGDHLAHLQRHQRGDVVGPLGDRLEDRAQDLAALMTLEMGKVVAESKGEVTYGAEFFRWFAEEAVRIGGRFTP
ncbi:NAD-dependent succinate-semialdehyde dehydrogenase, partial [Mycobacterium sp. ITM-2017-0098]